MYHGGLYPFPGRRRRLSAMTYDVAVVGAGPSGAWTARSLARRGVRVLLLDPSHPREKPCGGGITGRALSLVADAIDTSALPAVAIRSAKFTTSSSSRAADVPLPRAGLCVASRSVFDGLLLDSARRSGASVLESRVTDVRAIAGGFHIETLDRTYRATGLIGADGANSLVRRRLAEPFRRDQLSIATGFFAHGAESDEIRIEFVDEPPGYIWSFPRPGHLAIGICAQADGGVTSAMLRRIAAGWLARTKVAGEARLEPYAWPIPSLSSADLLALQPSGPCDGAAPGGPGWMLVGDAAGLVDPITREGIYFALRSAEWAADAVAAGGADPWRRYAERVREEIGAELARASRLKHRFFRPRFTRLMIDALRHSASVRAVMADLVAGEQGYGDLKWRLARTLELGLAARFFLGASRAETRA